MSAAITGVDVSLERPQLSRWTGALSALLRVGFVLLGADGDVDDATPTACQLFGATVPQGLRSIWAPVHDKLGPALRAASDAPALATITFDLAGETRRVRCEVHPLAEDDCVGHLLLVQSSERVDAIEGALRLASRYQTLNGMYLSTVHDFKGSLNAIVLNLELLGRTIESRAAADDRTVPRHCLKTMRQELGRLERSVGQILDGSRAEDRDSVRLPLAFLLESAVSLLRGRADRQRVAIEFSAPEQLIEVMGRPDDIRQAVVNLLNNSLDAMPGGGTLSLALRTDGDAAVMTVADTGPGIAPELRHRVWELYFSTRNGGHGIGLHVVRTVAESHGGTATLDRFEPGTQFSIRLPLAH